jgi:SPX domain protein involved in polyphosphate accumulation
MDNNYRFELKVPLSIEQLCDIRYWHRSTAPEFRKIYPDRVVNNIYFDSPFYDAFNDNSFGISDRVKCRLRWYGENNADAQPQFELKFRKAGLGFKRTQYFMADELNIYPLNSLYARLRQKLQPAYKEYLDKSHRPTIFNYYHREYYATKDDIRMTIDSKICHAWIRNAGIHTSELKKSTVHSILEFKFPKEKQRLSNTYLHRLPFRFEKNSKYVNAVNEY